MKYLKIKIAQKLNKLRKEKLKNEYEIIKNFEQRDLFNYQRSIEEQEKMNEKYIKEKKEQIDKMYKELYEKIEEIENETKI